jgi:hypothetical protein
MLREARYAPRAFVLVDLSVHRIPQLVEPCNPLGYIVLGTRLVLTKVDGDERLAAAIRDIPPPDERCPSLSGIRRQTSMTQVR